MHTTSYKADAKKALEKLYAGRDFKNTAERIEYVKHLLRGRKGFSFFAFGGEINEDMKLAALEEEWLIQEGKFLPQRF